MEAGVAAAAGVADDAAGVVRAVFAAHAVIGMSGALEAQDSDTEEAPAKKSKARREHGGWDVAETRVKAWEKSVDRGKAWEVGVMVAGVATFCSEALKPPYD
ncbi:hypothetical protein AB1Y20_000169 [Prymnesium parvum]|uniref:Uncharacterized protein n=1 Tax=Prymnesium parvum TaxID=97485 RepID=A0AB34K7Q5_PRYPA